MHERQHGGFGDANAGGQVGAVVAGQGGFQVLAQQLGRAVPVLAADDVEQAAPGRAARRMPAARVAATAGRLGPPTETNTSAAWPRARPRAGRCFAGRKVGHPHGFRRVAEDVHGVAALRVELVHQRGVDVYKGERMARQRGQVADIAAGNFAGADDEHRVSGQKQSFTESLVGGDSG